MVQSVKHQALAFGWEWNQAPLLGFSSALSLLKFLPLHSLSRGVGLSPHSLSLKLINLKKQPLNFYDQVRFICTTRITKE